MQTLTTGKIVGGVIGLVVVLGGGYMLMQKDVGDGTTQVPGVVAEETTKAPAKTSLKDLMGKAGAQKCTSVQTSTLSKSTTLYYFADGKMYGESESTILSGPGAGTSVKNLTIIDGDTLYSWDDTTKQGMKMSMTDMGKDMTPPPAGTKTTSTGGTTLADQYDQSYEYDCEPWKVDVSLFTPPKSVAFTDMSAMMKGLPKMDEMQKTLPKSGGAGTMMKVPPEMDMSAMCAQCDQAGDGREACRSAMGCK